jgi:hypothetical protein
MTARLTAESEALGGEVDRFLGIEPFSGAGISKPSSRSHKQNKASVLGRTLQVPTIVLTAALAT